MHLINKILFFSIKKKTKKKQKPLNLNIYIFEKYYTFTKEYSKRSEALRARGVKQ